MTLKRKILISGLSVGSTFLLGVSYGITVKTVLLFAFFELLIIISIVDYNTMEIPDKFVFTSFLIGVLSIFCIPELSAIERILGVLVVSVPMMLLTMAIPGAFGGGDIKLMGACGILLGWKLEIVAIIFAIIFAGVYAIFLLCQKKKKMKEHFAFGPFLCIGMAIALLWGEQFITWYL
jgi:leader peptidase (prepilin peptidase)/N-methyltransferase